MTLRIQRAADGAVVVFTLSGRIGGERVAELQSLLASDAANHHIVLDLHEVDLVDQAGVRFLARCEADGIQLEQCPGYIREWINREADCRGSPV
jgi:anti-anti-sigma regulatory factor